MYLFSTFQIRDAQKSDLLKYFFNFLLTICFLVGVSILFIDQQMTLLFKEDDWIWVLAREITHIGLFTNYFIPAFIVWLGVQILLKWNKTQNQALLKRIATRALWLMYCLLFSGLWTHIIKFIVGRQRPKISPEFAPLTFHPFTNNWDFHSMPSGHAQVLFTTATFMAFLFPRYKYGFYIIAFAMAFTRVMTRDHFYSDVLMGAAVGHLTTIILLYWLSRRNVPVITL